jgi:homocysteine S-methyltransferase
MGRGEAFIERLERGETVVGDGAMGTELMARGIAPGADLDAAPLRSPELVREVHQAHLEAGAELLRTATFAANEPRLAIAGLNGEWAAINREAVALARAAAGERAVVAGVLGPCFAPAEVEYGEDDLQEIHRRQAVELRDAGADLLICETFAGLREAAAAVRGALATGLPTIAQLAPLKPATADGVAIAPALLVLAEIGAAAVGVNCGSGVDAEENAIAAARSLLRDTPLTAFPNAGEPAKTLAGLRYPLDAQAIAERAVRLQQAGAGLIGGCCGTSPAAIAAISESLRR